MLTPEELEPSPEDLLEAEQLVKEGWHSVSAKFRGIARFREPVPRIEDLVSVEVLATNHGKRLAERWSKWSHTWDLRTNNAGVEHRDLSVKLYRAFRMKGGQSA
jgi:hypothetical protein